MPLFSQIPPYPNPISLYIAFHLSQKYNYSKYWHGKFIRVTGRFFCYGMMGVVFRNGHRYREYICEFSWETDASSKKIKISGDSVPDGDNLEMLTSGEWVVCRIGKHWHGDLNRDIIIMLGLQPIGLVRWGFWEKTQLRPVPIQISGWWLATESRERILRGGSHARNFRSV